jgi:hypothetical protein
MAEGRRAWAARCSAAGGSGCLGYLTIAVEIKAGSRISGEDFRGLRQLKERLGPRLEEAIILYTGEHAYTHEDWITVLPLHRLWG